MTFGKHLLLGAGASAVLYPFYGINAGWFLISSTLIDIDHYFFYLVKNSFKDFRPGAMLEFHRIIFDWRYRPDMLGLSVFHTFEFLLMTGTCAYLLKSVVLNVILLGFVFHMVCDTVFLVSHRIQFQRAYSLIEYRIRKSRMQRKGIDVNKVFREAIQLMEAS